MSQLILSSIVSKTYLQSEDIKVSPSGIKGIRTVYNCGLSASFFNANASDTFMTFGAPIRTFELSYAMREPNHMIDRVSVKKTHTKHTECYPRKSEAGLLL